jgi:8-oxo-dGTP diphosphatase
MEIQSTLTNRAGQVLHLTYRDVESEKELGDKKISGVRAYCFYQDKLVVVYGAEKGYWTPPGGGVEEGESTREAVIREVKEETNMRVLKQKLFGYQDVFEPERVVTETRSVCLVEPYGPFTHDPDGDITELKLIDPSECKTYFDWGAVGDRLMQRALEIKAQMDTEVVHEAKA